MTGPIVNTPIGVYRTPSADIAPVQAYETFLRFPAGIKVSYVLAYLADRPTWPQFEQGLLASRTNGPAGTQSVTAWAPLLGGRTLLLAVPACCNGTTWATEASGANDAHWLALGKLLVSAHLGTAVLRIGREFNGAWYPWDVTTSTASGNSVSNYQAGYAHIVSVLRSVPGQAFRFMWNPILGVINGNMAAGGVEQSYPGSAVTDMIGIDIYDGDWTGVYDPSFVRIQDQQLKSFQVNVLNCQDGLLAWQKLAAGWNKPLAYPEWGLRLWLDAGVYHGGGDDPLFIQEMAAWFKATRPAMHAFWEDQVRGVCDPDSDPHRDVAAPASRTAFLNCFGWPSP